MTNNAASDALYLAIDQGGSSTRAIVFDGQAKIVAKAQQTVPVLYPHPQWVEQCPDTLVDSIVQVINSVATQLGPRCMQLHTAGLATQRSNIVCWDKVTGKALSPAISWQDRRAHQWIKQFDTKNDLVHNTTGLLISAHYGVSKLYWCLNHIDGVAQAHKEGRLAWGPLASYITYQLVGGQHYADPVNASRTLLWNINTGDWDQPLLDLFGIPHGPLPQCVATQFKYGNIKIANTSNPSLPLSMVTGDQSAALFAYGSPDKHTAYINMGTGAFIQCSTGANPVDAPNLLSSIVYKDDKRSEYVLECTVNGASNALMLMEKELGIPYDEAEQRFATWLGRYQDPPLYLNGVAGLGAPFWVPDFESQFVQERDGGHEPGEKMVAVAESILFLLQLNLQLLNKQYVNLKRIVVTGGLSQSDGLCQKLANLTQLYVYRPGECEATAQGLAYLLAGFPGDWPGPVAGHDFRPVVDEPMDRRYKQWELEMNKQLRHYTRG